MKFSNLIPLASVASVYAQTYNAKLYVEYLPQDIGGDEYKPVDGQFLHAVKEYPDSYTFFLGSADEAVTIQWDSNKYLAFIQNSEGTYFLGLNEDFVLVAKADIKSADRLNFFTSNTEKTVFNYRSFDDRDYSFAPVKEIGDPINYSTDHFALEAGDDDDSRGALIHYELLGQDTGNGLGILNPSSIGGQVTVSNSFIVDTIYNTVVLTTNPATYPTASGSVKWDFGATEVPDSDTYDETDSRRHSHSHSRRQSHTRTRSHRSHSDYEFHSYWSDDLGIPLTSASFDDSSPGSTSGSSISLQAASITSGGSLSSPTSSESESISTARTTLSSSAITVSGNVVTEAKLSVSGTPTPGSSASSSKGEGNVRVVAYAAGILPLMAAFC